MPFTSRCLPACTLLLCAMASADNVVVGDGTPASCTEAGLDAALVTLVVGNQAPGGRLDFSCGAAPHTIALSAQKFLSGQVVIDGGGRITLDGQNTTRLFHVALDDPEGRTEVQLRDLTLTRGFASADHGGAILAHAGTRLALERVGITASRADLSGGAIGIEHGGTVLNITQSLFAQNRAADGGAIATSATTTIRGSRFFGNSADADQGGAIQSWVADLSIENSELRSNAADRGGAVYKRDGVLGIVGSRLSENLARQDGGAIYTEAGVEGVQIIASDLDNNLAAGSGGAILAERNLSLTLSNLRGNRADVGGAVRLLDAVFVGLSDASFSDNEARSRGGAIAAAAVTQPASLPPILSLAQITTWNNRVTGGAGGDVHLADGSPVVAIFESCTLMGASSTVGASAVHVGSLATATFGGSLLWSTSGTTCFTEPLGRIASAGFNLGPPAACQLDQPSDGALLSLPDFGLGEFANYGGRVDTFLPRPDSLAIDWRPCDGFSAPDARLRLRPVDGNGSGTAECDAGAVERQLIEIPAALLRNGFEAALGAGMSR